MYITLLLLFLIFFTAIAFLLLNKFNPTSLFTGFTLIVLIGIIITLFFFTIAAYNEQVALWVILPFALVFIFFAIFWVLILLIAVLINTKTILKRERKSVANLLPILTLVTLIVVKLALFLLDYYLGEFMIIKSMITFVDSLISYFILIFLLYTFTAIMYKVIPTFKKIDYVLILGSGLINDRVTPLLASRIDAGIAFVEKQKKHQATIILCGGQGADEGISEAQAMKNYIDENYEKEYLIYLEDQSTSTEENILFAEQVAQKHDDVSSFKMKNIAIATSNYHLLRSGKIAQKIGYSAFGIGGKTKFYYIPTAFIREFIGYIVLKKRFHIFIVIIIFIASIVSNLF